MCVELDDEEIALARELLESRIGEIHSEIRRCRVSRYRDELKDKLKLLEQLLGKFPAQAATPDA